MKKSLSRWLAMLLSMALIGGSAGCTSAETNNPTATVPVTESWNGSTSATIGKDDYEVPSGTFQVGKPTGGREVFALLCIDLGVTLLASELTDARLFLSIVGDQNPGKLRLGMYTSYVDGYFTAYDEALALVYPRSVAVVDATDEGNGWISLPVASFAKAWLSGEIQNNGLAIFGETDGEVHTFASVFVSESDSLRAPYIKASGEVGDRPLTYGKFGYTEIVSPDDTHSNGNCMSYALRDTNGILENDLGVDTGEIERIYKDAGPGDGVDALMDYFAKLAEDYVEAHKTDLQISGFRRIDGYDTPIDPAAEYRIAMRCGVKLLDGEPDFSDMHSWDFHFRVQLDDGRWAQKFPVTNSTIVPCSGPGIPPDRFPWDANDTRTPKFADYYTSKTVYFAVTKDTAKFTRHRGETMDRQEN